MDIEQLGNSTSVIRFDGWHFAPVARKIKEILRERPDAALQYGDIVMARLEAEELDVGEFEIGTRFGEGLALVNLESGESVVSPSEGQMDIRRYSAQFARKYKWSDVNFRVLVPERKGMIYVAHDIPGRSDRTFVQWAYHAHGREAEEILSDAEYGMFQVSGKPVLNLANLIRGERAFLMGEVLIGATGIYREIPRGKSI
ncbi:MAG: hypothetical protein HYW25_01450 [Candidatus Aenigmarchaeota archaeon]|nr:hypothetical protein [Candidatus Aenigmarchaeota archaeon]